MIENEDSLELEIGCALKQLPDLEAPADLAGRVRHCIEAKASRAWYRQPPGAWPALPKLGAMSLLAGLFAGLCYALLLAFRSRVALQAGYEMSSWISDVNTVRATCLLLGNALLLAIQKLGPVFIAAFLLIVGIAYTLCVAIGTVCFRVAVAKRS